MTYARHRRGRTRWRAADRYFEATAATAVYSGVFTFNRASLAVQKKLGFTETGVSRMHCLARNEEVRHIDTTLTRARWAGSAERALVQARG